MHCSTVRGPRNEIGKEYITGEICTTGSHEVFENYSIGILRDKCVYAIELSRVNPCNNSYVCVQTQWLHAYLLADTPVLSQLFLQCQAYKVALESLGHCEYAMKAGFHLNPKAIEASLQVGSAKPALSFVTPHLENNYFKKTIGLVIGFSQVFISSNWSVLLYLRAVAVKLKPSKQEGDRLHLSQFSVNCPLYLFR